MPLPIIGDLVEFVRSTPEQQKAWQREVENNLMTSEYIRAEKFRMALMALCRVHQFDVVAVVDGRDDSMLLFQHLPPDKPHEMLEAAELFTRDEAERRAYLDRRAFYPSPLGEPVESANDRRTLFQGPVDCDHSSPAWQTGYKEGEETLSPTSLDETYISGWCNGYSVAHQCDDVSAELGYYNALDAASLEAE
jgi:hypothetical protein